MKEVKRIKEEIETIMNNPISNEFSQLDIDYIFSEIRSCMEPQLDPRIERAINSDIEVKTLMSTEELLKKLGNDYDLKIDKTEVEDLSELIEEIGYYKFSGYRKPFLVYSGLDGRDWIGNYHQDVTFSDILSLINLDRELSTILFKNLKIIEKRVKQRGAYFISSHFGNSAPQLEINNFENPLKWIDYLNNNYASMLDNAKKSNDLSVLHHINRYDSKIPIWIFFEKISFGAFQHFLVLLKKEDRNSIREEIYNSKVFCDNISNYVPNSRYNDIVTIVRMVRNKIMHYGRIYDIEYIYHLPNNVDDTLKNAFYSAVYANDNDKKHGIIRLNGILKMMSFFLSQQEHTKMLNEVNSSISTHLKKIQEKYANHIIDIMNFKPSN